jgi:glutamate-1-semialdehyde 2,1-aminomutase
MDSPLEALGPPEAPTSVVDSDGVPAETAAQTTVVQFNDLASLEAVFDRFPGEIAAVVLEPLSESSGLIPPHEGYLEGVRDLTRRHGAVLIFDEVQTGARVAAGGATQLYGVTPDLLILGKAIGGGTAIGAFGGRRDLMELLAPLGRTGVAGTFSANPLSMAAGLACLTIALTDDVYSEIHRLAARLADGQRRIAAAHDLPVSIANVGSIGDVFFAREHPRSAREALATCDTATWHEFWFGMLSRGVIPMGSAWFKLWTVSAAHTEEDIDETLERTEETLTAIFGG